MKPAAPTGTVDAWWSGVRHLVGGALAFEEGRMGVDQLLMVKPSPDGRRSLSPVREF